MIILIVLVLFLILFLIGIALTAVGIVSIVSYFARKQKTRMGIILPICFVFIGELFALPIGLMFLIPNIAKISQYSFWFFILPVVLCISGIILFVICGINSHKNGKTDLKIFIPALVMTYIGFYMPAERILMFLL